MQGIHGRQQEELEDCVRAFTSGNKLMAEQLLPRIPLPTVCTITTTFELPECVRVCSMVTLLHLAAYWGWGNVVTELVSVYYCAANSKDSEGQIPLHYAAYNGHLEVVKYFTAQLQCDLLWRRTMMAGQHFTLLVLIRIKITSTLSSTSLKRNTVTHHLGTIMAKHHFTLLVVMVTSTLPSTSSERNIVIHHARTLLARHHFTLLVVMVTSTLPSTSSERNTVTHHVRPIQAGHHLTLLVYITTSTLYNAC